MTDFAGFGPMAEHEGAFDAATPSSIACRQCKRAMTVQLWRSHCGGYEDEKHTCSSCGYVLWIDGIDS